MYKPVILIGNGCRHNPALVAHLCSLNIPVLTTWMGADLVAEDNPAFCGRPGIHGQRAANIIMQKADRLLIIGARMDGGQVAHNLDGIAPNADVMVLDADEAELRKLPLHWTKKLIDLSSAEIRLLPNHRIDTAWLDWCRKLYFRFSPELADSVIDMLTALGMPGDVFAIGSSGTAPERFYQRFRVKQGQRIINACTIGAMGADIPMAIGACIASGKRRTICLTGDGGFQLNAQELAYAADLPIIFYVLCNDGYASIRNMQDARFDGHHVACDAESGLRIADVEALGRLYGANVIAIPDEPGYKDLDRLMFF